MNSNRALRFALTLTLFFLASFALAADQPAKSGITLTTQTGLVQVPVVITDKSGNPVSGLTKNDFEVLENGKPQSIASFEEIKTTNQRFSRPTGQRGVFSNALSGDESAKRLTIFALDLVNTPFLDQSYARAQLLKYLANRLNRQEPTALVAIRANGIRVLHDFTTDPAVLVEALRRATGEVPYTEAATDQISIEASQLSGFAGSAGIDPFTSLVMRDAIMVTLESFQHVAESYAGVPGRKSLIWATAAFPFGLDPVSGAILSPHVFSSGAIQQSAATAEYGSGNLPALPSSSQIRTSDDLKFLEPLYRCTIQMLNDANIAVYPVDARGLVVFFPGADVSRIEKLATFNQALFESSRQTMVDFAQMTGGKAFYNRNDLDVAFAKAADDSASYYMLGYYLEKNAKPGWHRLQVKAKHDGAQVHARNGFFVTPEKETRDVAKMDLKMALASPLDYTALPLAARWAGAEPMGGKKKVHFSLDISPSANLIDIGDKGHLSLEVLAVALTANGQTADHFAQHVEANFDADAIRTFQHDGLNYTNEIQVPPGEYSVKFILRDNLTGRVGSLTAPLRVAP